MDLAENYSYQSVQSAYWNSKMISLHPVVVYFKADNLILNENFVFVSDKHSHNEYALHAILTKLIPEL